MSVAHIIRLLSDRPYLVGKLAKEAMEQSIQARDYAAHIQDYPRWMQQEGGMTFSELLSLALQIVREWGPRWAEEWAKQWEEPI